MLTEWLLSVLWWLLLG